MTQGSSFLATLGFGTESHWDSGTAARHHPAFAAIRARRGRFDFLEDFAGNHASIFIFTAPAAH
jgi:hypothetical protein